MLSSRAVWLGEVVRAERSEAYLGAPSKLTGRSACRTLCSASCPWARRVGNPSGQACVVLCVYCVWRRFGSVTRGRGKAVRLPWAFAPLTQTAPDGESEAE